MDHNTIATHVMIATSEWEFRLRLLNILQAGPGFRVLGPVSDSSSAMRVAQQLRPDVVLLDSELPGIASGAEWASGPVRIILMTSAIDRAKVLAALQLSARGIVLKTSPPDVLRQAIRQVMASQYSFGADAVAILIQIVSSFLLQSDPEQFPADPALTCREVDVVRMIAAGNTNRRIAEQLSISERTVKHHLTSIFGKLQISSRLELALFATNHRSVSAVPA